MSTNNIEENTKAPSKPLPSKMVPLQRTVSAHPTLSEGLSSADNKELVKLNINAHVFVPKIKRSETTPNTVVSETSNEHTSIPVEKTEPTETLTPTKPISSSGGIYQPYQMQNFQSKYLIYM